MMDTAQETSSGYRPTDSFIDADPFPRHDPFFQSSTVEPKVDQSRPLGSFSTFVVERLPHLLNEIGNHPDSSEAAVHGLRNAANAQITSEEFGIRVQSVKGMPQEDQRVALLDLAVYEAGLRNHGCDIPPEVLKELDNLGAALNTLPGLSYELIVRVNPLNDLRTFTGSKGEKFFYSGHEDIERELGMAVAYLRDGEEVSRDSGRIAAALPHLERVTEVMGSFQTKVPVEEFLQMRPYLSESRDKKFGPSGFRSARMFEVPFLIMGSEMLHRINQIEKQSEYYPAFERDDLVSAMEIAKGRRDLFSICKNDSFPPALSDITEKLAQEYLRFLVIHLTSVHQFIRLDSNTEGTGGTQAESFLQTGIRKIQEPLSNFKEARAR